MANNVKPDENKRTQPVEPKQVLRVNSRFRMYKTCSVNCRILRLATVCRGAKEIT